MGVQHNVACLPQEFRGTGVPEPVDFLFLVSSFERPADLESEIGKYKLFSGFGGEHSGTSPFLSMDRNKALDLPYNLG